MTRLAVNIDHIATLREARKGTEPDPVAAAVLAELAGAHGITVHLRGDRRHIKERDVELLRATIKTQLNIEMAATQEMMKIAAALRPDIVTFVPERPNEVTTEGGLDAMLHGDALRSFSQILKDAGIRTSIFLDPDLDQIKAAHRLGADTVEINTLRYAAHAAPRSETPRRSDLAEEFEKIREAARMAVKFGIRVAAGHDLNYRNVGPVSAMEEVVELNIGHAIVARASLVGLERAVREMLEAMHTAF
ncbi:MAG: pyridoxine 5'-phosphate synthase [Acidobacteriota bacterium]|nr:MAG: pyridoxine 5'-phosphate synthase [Acidobacteriota bacterium]